METNQTEISKPWFRAKKYGYGCGLPIAWQGWMVFLAYIVLNSIPLILVVFLKSILLYLLVSPLILIVSSVELFKICKGKTAGGWKWRWGSK